MKILEIFVSFLPSQKKGEDPAIFWARSQSYSYEFKENFLSLARELSPEAPLEVVYFPDEKCVGLLSQEGVAFEVGVYGCTGVAMDFEINPLLWELTEERKALFRKAFPERLKMKVRELKVVLPQSA